MADDINVDEAMVVDVGMPEPVVVGTLPPPAPPVAPSPAINVGPVYGVSPLTEAMLRECQL